MFWEFPATLCQTPLRASLRSACRACLEIQTSQILVTSLAYFTQSTQFVALLEYVINIPHNIVLSKVLWALRARRIGSFGDRN